MAVLVPAPLATRIARISSEEIFRQHKLLAEGAALRTSMTLLVYALAALFIPLPLVIGCAVLDLGSERLGSLWMKGLEPANAPWRYLGTVAAGMASQLGYTGALAFCYQSDVPLAQPFAAGVLTLTILQMGSVRVIHQPYAATGLISSYLMAVVAVIHDWQSRSGPAGLVLSLIALAAAAYFIVAIIKSNHALHAGIARERAAARVADQAKSRFLAQMSHELRTPLNAILGLGHVELAQATDPASQERLRLVTDAARGLAVILDDILDMSAIEAGHLPIRPILCNPACEISAATALFRSLFEAQGLCVTLNLSPDLPAQMVMDSQRLRQCLSNLFSNALKYTTSGGVTLSAGQDAAGLLAIHFADTGPGIAPDQAAQLFQPFQRGSGYEPGSGLGLSITRALARSMGGDLQLVPSSRGAHFLLTLAPQPASDHSKPSVPPLVRPVEQRGLQVLVVDDIATNRLVAKAHLQLHGIIAQEAASGAEALEIIRTHPPDLVLLDMNMPDMDGTETLKRIRTLPSRAARVPVIAMTADATEAHRRKYIAAGMDGYLAKPLTPEAVADVIARYRVPGQ